jgi:hypothetical protein
MVDGPARADDRHAGSSSGAATGLTLGVCRRPVTDRLVGHGSIPKRDVTKSRAHKANARGHFFQAPELVVASIKSNRAAAVPLTSKTCTHGNKARWPYMDYRKPQALLT